MCNCSDFECHKSMSCSLNSVIYFFGICFVIVNIIGKLIPSGHACLKVKKKRWLFNRVFVDSWNKGCREKNYASLWFINMVKFLARTVHSEIGLSVFKIKIKLYKPPQKWCEALIWTRADETAWHRAGGWGISFFFSMAAVRMKRGLPGEMWWTLPVC